MRGQTSERNRFASRLILAVLVLGAILAAGALFWRNDILEARLDPKVPYSVYRPPPPPDYEQSSAWAHLPIRDPGVVGADVFFLHPTTYDGGRDWNGPIGNRSSRALIVRVVLPNWAEPFEASGRVFAPLYRQASLYSSLSLFDDALDAREFAYGDVLSAFYAFLARTPPGRPFILVGVEQGGLLAARLLSQRIAPDPALRARLIAVYFIDTVVPADQYAPGAPVPACARRGETGCVLAWKALVGPGFDRASLILGRARVWNGEGLLVPLDGRTALCVNPLLGARGEAQAPAWMNLGAADATGLEWGVRPGFIVAATGARCQGGFLRAEHPGSPSLRPHGGFAERLRAPAYDLFWANIEADALERTHAFFASQPAAARRSSPSFSKRAASTRAGSEGP
ncbi:MAG: DUF3089 domain-containing protein [Caulobacteraceae bacterium]